MNQTHARSLVLAASLLTLALAGCSTDGSETPVAMGDLPGAVRATLDRETAGGQVTEIEREKKKDKTVYSADATIDGVAWDIAIAEDGTLISKEKE